MLGKNINNDTKAESESINLIVNFNIILILNIDLIIM